MCHDDYAPLGAIVFSPWQAKVNANGLFLPVEFVRHKSADDFAGVFCIFSAAMASALNAASLQSLWDAQPCGTYDGWRMVTRVDGYDSVSRRCGSTGVDYIVAVDSTDERVAGLHFGATDGDYATIPTSCSRSTSRACNGGGGH